MLSGANYRRYLKGKLQDLFVSNGFSVSCTDSAEICLFSDLPIDKRSIKFYGNNVKEPYLTSFGIKTAEKVLGIK